MSRMMRPRRTVLALALAASWMGSGTSAQVAYERHVFFDNSLTDTAYFHSEATSVGPSALADVEGKLPVGRERVVTPPHALRLAWTSRTGGTWRAAIRLDRWRNRNTEFIGDTLAFWAYADSAVSAEAMPIFGLEDEGGLAQSVRLGDVVGGLPAQQWTQVKLPLSAFALELADGRALDVHRPVTLFFEQWLDDGTPHTLYLDEIKIYEGDTGDREPPPPPDSLTARGFERHIELAWTSVRAEDLQGYLIERALEGEDFEAVWVYSRPWFRRYADCRGRAGAAVPATASAPTTSTATGRDLRQKSRPPPARWTTRNS